MSIRLKVLSMLSSFMVLLGCSNSNKALKSNSTINPGVSFYDLSILDLNGKDTIDFSTFKGKKVLLVNVASKCGYTPQYEGLQTLYEGNLDNLVIIGFPCNQFLFQEPGSGDDIKSFCSVNYGVTFPLSAKIDVKGENQHPVYQWLTRKALNGKDDYSISWNFNKFLISENGELLAHFGSDIKPLGPEIAALLN